MKDVDIYHADCFDILPKIKASSVDMILTDPPYGMNFQSNARNVKYDKIINDDNLDFLPTLVTEFYRIAKNNTAHYVFCSHHNIDIFKQEFERLFKLKNILVWVKNNRTMGDLAGNFASRTEFILFIQKGRAKIQGRRDSNVLNYNSTGNLVHPTQKPVNLCKYLIEKFSKPEDVIFDPFMGSGTTGIAAAGMNRKFIGVEKHDKYFKIAKMRIETTK